MAKRIIEQEFTPLTTDAFWRARVGEISAALTAVGFIRASDTGQIDTATTLLPAAGADGGYEIRYLNDSLHSTAPVYVRITYGRTSVDTLRMRLVVGFATDGAGNITGINTGEIDTTWPYPAQSAGIIPSYFCADAGFVWVSYMPGYTLPVGPASMSTWMLARTVNAAGAITADGVSIYYTVHTENNPGLARRAMSRSAVYSADKSYSLVIGALTSTETGAGPQVYRHYTPTPRAAPLRHIVTYVDPEISAGAVVSLAVVGSPLDYLALGPQVPKCSVTSVQAHCVALAWTGPTV